MITEGHLTRHYQGRKGGRWPAIIDIAQDHALVLLDRAGVFDLGVVFKGGTALRKFRAGNAGRFSTDLDFAGTDEASAELLLETLDGATLGGFAFRIEPINAVRRSYLHIDSPFGATEIPARIDCSYKKPWMAAEILAPVPLPVHSSYDIELSSIPVMPVAEVLAEKLARYRRASLARDLYDLAWFANGGALDEPLIRRLTVLKVWHDVVEDKLGDRPFDPAVDVAGKREQHLFDQEAIGYLTTPVDLPGWIRSVAQRFSFIADLDPDERRIATCNPGHRWEVGEMINHINKSVE